LNVRPLGGGLDAWEIGGHGIGPIAEPSDAHADAARPSHATS
jgi:hypothetical protein